MDSLIDRYLRADEEGSQDLLANLLVDRAEPTARRVVAGQLRAPRWTEMDREDAVSTVTIRVTRRLRELRVDPTDGEIQDFVSYVATVAYNACFEQLRSRAPLRASLSARLRYLAKRGATLRLERGDRGDWICWPESPPENAREAAFRLTEAVRQELGEGPMPFSELVEAVSHRLGEVDRAEPDEPLSVADPSPSQEKRVDDVEILRRLWEEVRELPPRQRAALLLNLRDASGREMTSLLPAVGVASWDEVARCLGVEGGDAERLLADLPRDDAFIAEWLGVSRRQVINLRKAARARLARRLAPWRAA